MKEFEQRVIAEKRELDRKRKSLANFMSSNEFLRLPVYSRDQLIAQRGAMFRYSQILADRIEAFAPAEEFT